MSGGWNSDDQWQSVSGSSGTTGFDTNATTGLDFPVLPTIPSGGGINIGAVAPVFGVSGGYDDNAADYLEFDKRGRPAFEQMSGLTGTAYFTGIFGGGALGAAQGLSRSPSTKFKIRLNSMMNGAGRSGSKAGNALGCLAMMYKTFEGIGDSLELENYVKFDQFTPILAATATGLLYKSTAGPRATILAGMLGGTVMTAIQFAKPLYRK